MSPSAPRALVTSVLGHADIRSAVSYTTVIRTDPRELLQRAWGASSTEEERPAENSAT